MQAPNVAAVRQEIELLGEQPVPVEVYYGIHSLHASKNFALSGITLQNTVPMTLGQEFRALRRSRMFYDQVGVI
ncbi:hypothetical protein [Zobellella maritima]|uniref:hypothetical protein n=1 Tax=Zobellella maritima TaxID=2059725 RepID=UPI00130094FA|nr:hypothetical protein [Zobellella maritima]